MPSSQAEQGMSLSGLEMSGTTPTNIGTDTESRVVIGMMENRRRAIGEAASNDTTMAMLTMMSQENIPNTIAALREILLRL